MSEKEKLKYSNAIPRWAKIVHKIILWFFYLIAFATLVFGVALIFWHQWFGAIACFAGSGLFGWLSRFIRWSNKLYTDLDVKCELQEKGYYTAVKNIKTGEEWEQFVPFHQMQEVLIARTTRYQSRGSNSLGYHIIGAKIIMKWINEQGNIEYSLFGLEDSKNVEEWVQRFKQNEIPVFSSAVNVNEVKIEDYQKGYEELPKMPYDEDTTSPKVGTIRYRNLKVWRSSEMEEKKRKKELLLDRKVFNLILLAMLVGNFLAALGWMPSWQLNDGTFVDDSPSFVMTGINFILLFIVGAYWRKQVKWYRSLRDVGLILFVQLVGWGFARILQTAPDGMLDAIFIDILVLAFFNGVFFILFRLLRKFFDRFLSI